MAFVIDRRLLLKAGTLGLGALAVPGVAQLLTARGFTHDVASGEPRQHQVMLWTRYVPATGDAARLAWQVSRTPDFARLAAQGEVVAEAAHDYCVKPVAEGLRPGEWYFYRFRGPSGHYSPVGRTRTLPDGPVGRFALGFFSCANLPFGWFNAYGHAAARRDLDLMVHLGDYLYEYGVGHYPDPGEETPGRLIEPVTELIHLADYRLRYAAYRSDPDLQRLHRLFPMIAMWDDHESANDSWEGGAQNHQPDTEGPWAARKAAAVQANREWLPVADDAAWESYEIGDLATLFKPETRLTARSRQFTYGAVLRGQSNRAAALTAFRDGPWQDPARTLMGPEQEAWLARGLRQSAARGAKWQVLAQQVVMGNVALPPEAQSWPAPDAPERTRNAVAAGIDAGRVGLPFNLDNWDGYPAARRRLLGAALEANANLVVLSGDSHNAWGFDLDLDGHPAGVEFAGHSVTSPGYESELAVDPAVLARAAVARNPQLKWTDMSRRGYASLTLTPARATGEWLFLDTIRRRSTRLAGTHAMSTTRGTNRLG